MSFQSCHLISSCYIRPTLKIIKVFFESWFQKKSLKLISFIVSAIDLVQFFSISYLDYCSNIISNLSDFCFFHKSCTFLPTSKKVLSKLMQIWLYPFISCHLLSYISLNAPHFLVSSWCCPSIWMEYSPILLSGVISSANPPWLLPLSQQRYYSLLSITSASCIFSYNFYILVYCNYFYIFIDISSVRYTPSSFKIETVL